MMGQNILIIYISNLSGGNSVRFKNAGDLGRFYYDISYFGEYNMLNNNALVYLITYHKWRLFLNENPFATLFSPYGGTKGHPPFSSVVNVLQKKTKKRHNIFGCSFFFTRCTQLVS